MNHLGDTNKMVDTPRTDAVWELFATDTTLEPDVEFSGLARQLERELNAANAQVDRMTAKVAQLYEGGEEQKQRIKRLEKELSECNAHRERLIVSAMEAWGRIDEQEDSR